MIVASSELHSMKLSYNVRFVHSKIHSLSVSSSLSNVSVSLVNRVHLTKSVGRDSRTNIFLDPN